jgi:hypothetical protein
VCAVHAAEPRSDIIDITTELLVLTVDFDAKLRTPEDMDLGKSIVVDVRARLDRTHPDRTTQSWDRPHSDKTVSQELAGSESIPSADSKENLNWWREIGLSSKFPIGWPGP